MIFVGLLGLLCREHVPVLQANEAGTQKDLDLHWSQFSRKRKLDSSVRFITQDWLTRS